MAFKKHYLLFILFLFQKIILGQSWVQISDFPNTERDDGISFVIGNKAFCGTGVKTGFIACNDMYSFDLNTETWETINSLPSGMERQYAEGFSFNDYGFVFGGINGNTFFNDLWMYNPVNNNWQSKTPLPDEARMGVSSFVINDTAYIIGGRTSTALSISEMWAYCISADTWTFKGNLPFGERWRASAVSDNAKGYLIFGNDASEINRKELYEFNPLSNSWTQIGNFPGHGRVYSSLSYMNGNLIVVAGLDSIGNSYNDMWQFNLNTLAWQQLASIPAAERRGGMSFNSSSTLYYSAGINQANTRLKETWKVLNPTSIPNNDLNARITIYPNPAVNQITVDFETSEINIDNIILRNAVGQIFKAYDSKIITKGVIQYDVSNLQGGFYYLTLQSYNQNIIRKIIITK